jgi:predicted dehydrogenase
MSDPISIALIGIGGYGNNFVSALLDAPNQSDFRFVGTVDPAPASCRRLADLRAKSVPLYPSLEAFYETDRADLAIISSPIQFHAEQTCLALEKGSHVLCEKPLCATLQQARQMQDARDRTGRIVAVGYQWSFSEAIHKLKADVGSGVLGKPKRLRTLVLWPRDEAYYSRNRWAGAIEDSSGRLVLDSPVNNACAHYLHNMLYVLGEKIDRSADPATVTAELYRANKIPNYDTAALRCVTRAGTELLFIVSHAIGANVGPVFSYEFENATIDFSEKPGANIIARFTDGTIRNYGSPNQSRDRKLWMTVNATQGADPQVCGIEASLPHTQCVLAGQKSRPQIIDFPASIIQVSGTPGHRKTVVEGLDAVLTRCYDEGKLPSELDVAWAEAARPISISELA